ncbi:TSUP family transporter [Arcobacter arenosus]|uniref:TSUP family transporter n=1 Tax=Arcobacter arenosus TaxID=2576037 RepID=UPI003BAC616B
MEFEILIYITIFLTLAAFVHGSVGFGFPMIATPLIAMFTDLQTAIIYTLIPTLLVNILSIRSEGNFFEAVKKFYPLAILAMIGSAIGTQIIIHFNTDLFKFILVFVILLYLFFDYKKVEFPFIRENPNISKTIFGIGSGIIGGLTNVMSATLIIYVLESKFTKKEIVQSFNICFLFGKVVQIILFTSAGIFTQTEISQSLLPLVFISIAIFVGIKIRNKINPVTYAKMVKGVLFLIAIALFIQTI